MSYFARSISHVPGRKTMDLLVSHAMNKNVKSVRPDVTLPELERRFVDERVSGLPVVDEGTLRGVVSWSDIFRQMCQERSDAEVASGFYEDGCGIDMPLPAAVAEWISESVGRHMDHLRVRDVMLRQLITVSPHDRLLDAARKMKLYRIHRILVVEQRQLVGIITSLDFVWLYADERIGQVPQFTNRDF